MDKDLRIKIKVDSETGKVDVLNSKINNTSKGFNQADTAASAFASKLDSLNGKIKTAFDSKQIDDMIKKTLNPYGYELDQINKKWNSILFTIQKNGGSTASVFAAWNKEISNLETTKVDVLNSKINTTSKGFNQADTVASAFTNRILTLGAAYLSLNSAINAGKYFINQADSMRSLDSRLKLATSSTSEYLLEQKKLTQISLDAHTAISDTTTLFTKLNPALKQVGANTVQVNSVVGSFSEGLQLGGATAEETKSAILQFSQAMGSGVLRGEEFNAMAEASPKLMEYMAKGLGVPQTALRKMAEDGELTAVRVSNALLKVKTDIEADFKTMPVAVEKSMTDLSTYMSLGIKDIDEATGASTALSGAILDFGKSIGDISEGVISFYQNTATFIKDHNEALDTTGTIVKTVATAYIGFAVTSGIATGIGAITTSAYALRTSILALETSIPVIGWVAAAVGAAAGAYVLANDMMDESNNSQSISADRLNEKIQELQKRRDSLAQNKYTDSNTKTINLEIEALQSKLRIIDNTNKSRIQSAQNIIPQEKTAINELVDGWDGYVKATELIDTKKKTFSEFTQEIQKQIDPVRAIHEEYNKLREKIKGTEADTPEYNKSLNQKELDDIAKLDKEKISKAKELATEQKRIAKDKAAVESEFNLIGLNEWDTKFKELENKYNADLVKYAEIAGAKEKIDAVYEDNKKNLANQKEIALQKDDLSYYERKIQLQSDSLDKELELQGINYANKVLEIENTTKAIEEKDKLIAKETELNNLVTQNLIYKDNLEFQTTMSSFYDDMLDSQLALNNAVYDFGSGFDGAASKIGNVSKSIAAMSSLELTNKKEASKLDKKYIEQFNKYAGDVDKTGALAKQYEIDTGILKEQNIQAQIAGYANIAGAMSGMFAQGSKDAAAFQVVESTLALVAGVRAVISQGSGDPYTSFARMAAMAATVSSLLSSIGVAFGMNKTTTVSDSFSSTTANDGSGSVLGDSKKQSESITNALDTLKDFANPEYQTLLSMNNYLATIANNIGGVATLLVQNSKFALGEGFTAKNTGWTNKISSGAQTGLGLVGGVASDLLIGGNASMGVSASLALTGASTLTSALLASTGIGIVTALVDKFILGGAISSAVGSVVGGLFGKTKITQSLQDSGIYFADTLLSSAVESFDGSAYQTIKTTKTKKSWFGKSSSSSTKSYFDELDSETERQFSLVLDNLYNTVLVSGLALDSASEQTANSLSNFVVSIGKVSLKDLTGDEIQEKLTNIFGEIGDNIAKTAFPALTSFQQVGEGMFETLTRVATGMETAEYYIGRLGNSFADITYTAILNKQGDVGFEALRQSIDKFDEATYGANNNLVKIIDSLDGTAQELYTVYTTLDGLRDRLIFLGQNSSGISSSMIYGAGSVDALSSGFSSYFENFLSSSEQLAFKTSQLNETFASLGVQMPNTNTDFKNLLSSLDLTSESGQELYGRLITISDSFAEISSLRVSALQDELDITNTSISNIQEISTSLDTVITSLRSGLDTSSTNLLEKFNSSMATSLLLSNGSDYTALANSVKESINYSSALNNSDYFGSLKDMQYAQSVAANQFESMNLNLDTELSVLQKIANNTNDMIAALSNLTSAVKTLNESSSLTASNTAVSRIA